MIKHDNLDVWIRLICVQSIIAIILAGCAKNAESPKPRMCNFDELFIVSEKFTFEGDKDNPIVSPGKGIAITKNKVYLPDGAGNQVIVYDRAIDSVGSFGRRGQGPGEFINPTQVIVERDDSSIKVVDSGNFRLQIFDSSFNFKMSQSFTENIQQFYIQNQDDGLHYWIVGPTTMDNDVYVLTEYGLRSNSVNRYCPHDPGKIKFYSWVSDMDKSGTIFIANIMVPEIEVFDSRGKHLRKIILSGSFDPSDVFSETPRTRQKQKKQLQEFNKNPSQIMSIKIHKELLFVTVAGNHGDKMCLLLDIYDKSGNLMYFGIVPPGLLLYTDVDNLYFMEAIQESQFTKIVVHIVVMKDKID